MTSENQQMSDTPIGTIAPQHEIDLNTVLEDDTHALDQDDPLYKFGLDESKEFPMLEEKEAPPPQREGPLPIDFIFTGTGAIPDYKGNSVCNIRRTMETRYQVVCPELKLFTPAVYENMVAMGTLNGLTNVITIVDAEVIRNGEIRQDPIVATSRVNRPITSLIWLNHNLLVAAAGDTGERGHLQLFQTHENSNPDAPLDQLEIKCCGNEEVAVTNDQIRQMAVHPSSSNLICIGSDDNAIAIYDITSSNTIDHRFMTDKVGSVKWGTFAASRYVSCTSDDGQFCLFDTAEGFAKKPACAISTKAHLWGGLYSHERYSDHHVMLGFGDGNLEHWDLRNTAAPLKSAFYDPYVTAVGEILYDQKNHRMITSGATDFTVWQHYMSGDKEGNMDILFHSALGGNKKFEPSSNEVSAVFLGDDAIFSCNTTGFASVYVI
mmetsp:Transcript_4900/g.9473  ORF Transcript_4900/g.9473 Transcript_4900/m.9473 type:complete len:435 (-) Transcript_4900:361-1665(-)|eukprot:CAMPEP_0175151054 /NCGR_PEP_ID=MMETSP0087-20121206/18258_1 /TAXON_ID=136419 /ORGANISM="Unknown Unknown, Strain D1" /LENGTH=434 /DNA_ID=CAMNT_0016437159 /DNA_START=216 /DNA_END=1520 /DNA_ORIENTATION=-